MTHAFDGFEVVLAEVSIGDLDVAQRHADLSVPQEFHDAGEADAVPQELGGVGVTPMSSET